MIFTIISRIEVLKASSQEVWFRAESMRYYQDMVKFLSTALFLKFSELQKSKTRNLQTKTVTPKVLLN